jgi:hypothetical protein
MDEQYLIECKENAIWKKNLELEILHNHSISIPIASSEFENYVYFNPNSLESRELVMEWVRDVRLGSNYKDMLYHQISSHEGFMGLYTLNSLRQSKNPNFLYLHGITGVKEKENTIFYALSEDLFYEEDIFSLSFRDICSKENWVSILNYYLSLLHSLSDANKKIQYSNYDLNVDNIMMRNMNSAIFDVEYIFDDKSIWVTNYGFIPTITRFSKSYCKIPIGNIPKSFGYNNISQIPFENKGIYCDRGFVITDAYSILMGILETTYKSNIEAYNKLKILHLFFFKDEPHLLFKDRYFLHYRENTSQLDINNYIKFIYKKFPEFLSFSPKNDVIRCIGSKLEIKSKSLDYYSVKNTIQLYDFLNYYTNMINEYNENDITDIINKGIVYYNKFYEKENGKKDYNRFLSIEFLLQQRNFIFEAPEEILIYNTKDFNEVYQSYIENCIYYFNCWERLKTGIKIYDYLKSNSDLIKSLNEKFNSMYTLNFEYYDSVYKSLIKLRTFLRKNLSLFSSYKKQILFLETLE